MAKVITEGRRPSEFIVSEANGRRSRDTVIVAEDQNLGPSTVVGKITASGEVTELDTDASTGEEAAYGILIYPADATGIAEGVAVAAITREAEVNGDLIVWPEGISAPDKTAAIAELETRGIIVR